MKKALAEAYVDLKNRPHTPLPCQHLLLFLATTVLMTQELQRCYLNVPDEEGEYCRTERDFISKPHQKPNEILHRPPLKTLIYEFF